MNTSASTNAGYNLRWQGSTPRFAEDLQIVRLPEKPWPRNWISRYFALPLIDRLARLV